LVVTEDTVIDLSRAITAPWDSMNTGTNIGVGRYDPEKWAIVLHYQSVTIQGGATVTFINHPSRAPVVWLVQGDVTINGTVNLTGQSGLPAPWLAEPGPGGFRGATGVYAQGAGASAGFGVGGGVASDYPNRSASGGSYGTVGSPGSVAYGNPSCIPLIGGSGGGGYTGGGAGGGALLIAVANGLSINGEIRANGGWGAAGVGNWISGGGSGGAIRLVADTFSGTGIVQCLAGGADNPIVAGGLGRIRIERVTNTFMPLPIPQPSVVELSPGATPVIWLPTEGPTVKIVSISGVPAPADPRAEFGSVGADVVVPRVTSVTVIVETSYVEWPTGTNQPASIITVRATPRSDGNFTVATATPIMPPISEDPPVIRWTANVPVQDGYSAIQVKVVRP